MDIALASVFEHIGKFNRYSTLVYNEINIHRHTQVGRVIGCFEFLCVFYCGTHVGIAWKKNINKLSRDL